jgi:glycerol-3-phosphate acyltransferase PlsY
MSDQSLWLVGAALVAYLAGSIPFGLIIGKRRGVDVRTTGSGNIGATNVARALGKKIGLLVLVLDALKGALPMAAVQVFDLGDRGGSHLVTVVGLAAIIGHCFPLWLRFHGGKGVATALGVFLVLDPMSTGIAVAVFLAFYGAFRVVSLGSMAGAIAYPLLLWVFDRPPAWIDLSVLAGILVVAKHHENIRRLLGKSELGAP